MDQLEQARAQIDAIDAQMAALFTQRMQAVVQVAQYKAATGKPVFDPAREDALIAKNTARVPGELCAYYRRFLQQSLAVSRAYQRRLLGRDVAAYQGVQGAWSHIALTLLLPFASAKAYATWADVCDAVEAGDAQYGVLPFENSNAGDVSAVLRSALCTPAAHGRPHGQPAHPPGPAGAAGRDARGHPHRRQPPAGAGAVQPVPQIARAGSAPLGQHGRRRPPCGRKR